MILSGALAQDLKNLGNGSTLQVIPIEDGRVLVVASCNLTDWNAIANIVRFVITSKPKAQAPRCLSLVDHLEPLCTRWLPGHSATPVVFGAILLSVIGLLILSSCISASWKLCRGKPMLQPLRCLIQVLTALRSLTTVLASFLGHA